MDHLSYQPAVWIDFKSYLFMLYSQLSYNTVCSTYSSSKPIRSSLEVLIHLALSIIAMKYINTANLKDNVLAWVIDWQNHNQWQWIARYKKKVAVIWQHHAIPVILFISTSIVSVLMPCQPKVQKRSSRLKKYRTTALPPRWRRRGP